ncbi:hypothetical protein BV898_16167 [Hypsibius exemplaris]|uniref:CBM1 domain-containing protein n=1 Tax=Hypsibius exemplaris TaxID=2072580 RepID=A0A9X6RL16_HYPEX|nr:hypothetical protein BV898_16167 [Hypsibius exemplaris]
MNTFVFAALFLVSVCVAQDCSTFQNGFQCGCGNGFCWSYTNPAGNVKLWSDSDPWCYTAPVGGALCWPCKADAECQWQAPCSKAGNAQHIGNDTVGPTGCSA